MSSPEGSGGVGEKRKARGREYSFSARSRLGLGGGRPWDLKRWGMRAREGGGMREPTTGDGRGRKEGLRSGRRTWLLCLRLRVVIKIKGSLSPSGSHSPGQLPTSLWHTPATHLTYTTYSTKRSATVVTVIKDTKQQIIH